MSVLIEVSLIRNEYTPMLEYVHVGNFFVSRVPCVGELLSSNEYGPVVVVEVAHNLEQEDCLYDAKVFVKE